MLKIKDMVDLKELKKFGFINEDGYVIKDVDCCSYYLDKCTRIIQVVYFDNYEETEIDDTLYDLITAELVEKV